MSVLERQPLKLALPPFFIMFYWTFYEFPVKKESDFPFPWCWSCLKDVRSRVLGQKSKYQRNSLQAWPRLSDETFSPEFFCPNHQRFAICGLSKTEYLTLFWQGKHQRKVIQAWARLPLKRLLPSTSAWIINVLPDKLHGKNSYS